MRFIRVVGLWAAGLRGGRVQPSSRLNTTLNDGYLGLVIDEGRSEVRKVS